MHMSYGTELALCMLQPTYPYRASWTPYSATTSRRSLIVINVASTRTARNEKDAAGVAVSTFEKVRGPVGRRMEPSTGNCGADKVTITAAAALRATEGIIALNSAVSVPQATFECAHMAEQREFDRQLELARIIDRQAERDHL
eukprot:6212773-Pleurochrysis_carterae.AAC.4